MEDILRTLILWVIHHPHWSGLVVFLIACGESVAILGTIVPGSIMMTGIGALIGAGVLPPVTTILFAIAGAVAGDGVSYSIGHALKERLRTIWPFKKNQHWLNHSIQFFGRHGGKSVFLGRFIGPIRAIVPLIAGALNMKRTRFFFANISSAVLWAPIYMLPGIMLGAASLALPADIAGHYMWYLLLGLLCLLVISWVIKLFLTFLISHVQTGLNKVWAVMKKTPGLAMINDALRHFKEDHPRGQLGVLSCLLFAVILFVLLLFNIYFYGSQATPMNMQLYHFLRGLRNPHLDQVMLLISLLGQKQVILPCVLTASIWLGYRRCWRASIHWLLSGGVLAVSVYLLKHIIHSPRPPGLLMSAKDYSFPSGHVSLSVGIYGFAAYLIASRWPKRMRWSCYFTAACISLLVALSRLYLGAHWLTDIIGGILLGLICVLVFIMSYQRNPVQRIKPLGFLFTILLSLFVCGGFYAYKNEKLLQHDYQPIWPQKTIELQQWWNRGHIHPHYMRQSRFGRPKELLNIQWAGKLTTITHALQSQQWKKPAASNWVETLENPSNKTSPKIYIKTLLFNDRRPILIMVKESSEHNKQIILRLWPTGVHFRQDLSTLKLWVGLVTTKNDHQREASDDPITINQILQNDFSVAQHFDKKIIEANNIQIGKKYREIETRDILMLKAKP